MINPRKSLGQNFLIDAGVSRRIVDSVSPSGSDLVIEIGPGTGALTRMLAERSGAVVAVEIDKRLIEELRSSITAKNVLIVEADALEADYLGLIERAAESFEGAGANSSGGPRARVVANLPYYISTPIIERLIGLGRSISDMTLMLQKEVVDRIASPPGSKDYGYLSVLVQYYAAATKLFEVPPSAFRPAPRVQSAVVRLVVRDRPATRVSDEARFLALVRAAFAQRRKTILNNLKAAERALGFPAGLQAALESAGIDARRRAETLSLEDFGALFRALAGE